MLFNSFAFLFGFLPLTLVGFYVAGQVSLRVALLWLTAASMVFYGWWNPAFVGLLVLSIGFNFGCGRVIVARRQAGRPTGKVLAAAIVVNLAALAYYKYMGFFASLAGLDVGSIVLPLGISFFTFTQMAFLIDAHRGLACELDPLRYTLFVTYFPHLLSGPILHHGEMMPQFADRKILRLRWRVLAPALTILIIGLFKKVVLADSLAPYVNRIFTFVDGGNPVSFAEAWAGALAYTLQIYFDFSGYSDAAVGLSLLFGVRLPINFFSPYRAVSIVDFWRRWHMTLSRFLRDYLYFPLGGNRKGTAWRYVNLMVTMVLGGFWHGAGWTFLVWGALHGAYLAINHAFHGVAAALRLPNCGRAGAFAGWVLTFTAVVFAWVFFRAQTMPGALLMTKAMCGYGGIALPPGLKGVLGPLAAVGVSFDGLAINYLPDKRTQAVMLGMLAVALLAPNSYQLLGWRRLVISSPGTAPEGRRWRPSLPWAVTLAAMLVMVVASLAQPTEFLYFNF